MSASETITSVLGNAPSVLVEYFEAGRFRVRPASRIHCLPLSEAAKYTQSLIGLPLGEHFGLFALDDAEDSNPFCYVSRGPCAGAVLHLMHDSEAYISHRSLESFLWALDSLPQSDDIDNLPMEEGIEFNTEDTIGDLLSSHDADILLPVYLPVTAVLSIDTKAALSSSDDMYVREAFAEWMLHHGISADLPFAMQLAEDRMSQVVKLAKQALSRIRRNR